MKKRVPGGRPVAWEDAGRQIAPLLGSYSSAVVTSTDPVAAAHVALGLAREEAKRRRVVVGDLVGDLAPLRSLVKDEDPHGISDSFMYGLSMNKIEHAVEGAENLFVMPSGTEPELGDEIYRSERWKRVSAGFAEMGALLLLVTKIDSPTLAELIEQLDGAVVVKDENILAAPSALVLARVASPTPTLKIALLRRRVGAASWPRRRWLYPGLAGVGILLVAFLAFVFMTGRGGERRPAQMPAMPKSGPRPAPAPAETLTIAPPANASDSPSASAFAVLMVVANTPEGANFVLRKNSTLIPSITVTPVPIGPERATWYRVIAGAYAQKYQADSLLLALRQSRILADSAGNVLRAPLALLVDSVPSQGGVDNAVRGAVGKYVARGLPVYALMQDEGGARLFAGAFESADQSAELTRTLHGAGLNPVLVYRTGRAP